MQQYLPFTVLKPDCNINIEYFFELQQYLPFTVLKHCSSGFGIATTHQVATVPTVYGIETEDNLLYLPSSSKLQQYLPFTVLKRQY